MTTATRHGSGVAIEGLAKRYGDTVALSSLTLEARSGEILGVAGPNGAGKSTLVKVLAGEVAPDGGTVHVNGDLWSSDLGAHRIAIVHQEPQLFPNLTVAENLMAGREPYKARRPRVQPEDRAMLAETGLLAHAHRPLGELPLALQQRTEIARALVRNADVFLFDEPNSALTEHESEELFGRMHRIAETGRVVIFVTHRLAELAAHADRVAIIIDGACRTVFEAPELSEGLIARELVLGRVSVSRAAQAQSEEEAQGTLLTLTEWTHTSGMFRGVDLAIGRGEIVAVVGVEGSGGRELVRSVAGLAKASGEFRLVDQMAPSANRIAFVAADRADSLFENLSVGENLYIRQGARIRNRWGLLRSSVAKQLARQARAQFEVKTASLETPIRSLSGGNQQKVAIASALALDPSLVVLEEPTRGVDVSSKAEIYRLLRNFAAGGGAILLFCTEDSEVFDVADRATVVSRGRVVGALRCAKFPDAETLAERIAVLSVGLPEDLPVEHDTTNQGDAR